MQANSFQLAVLIAATVIAQPLLAQVNSCSTAEINIAYTHAGRTPNGSGISGECSPSNYYSHNGAKWTSQADLDARVRDYINVVGNKSPAPAPAPRTIVPANYTWYVDSRQNLVANTASATVLAPAGTYALVNPDGSAVSLVASGGGNLVASGGGNLVASGGGNMTSSYHIASAPGKKVFIVKR
jgi:hypothetical protein